MGSRLGALALCIAAALAQGGCAGKDARSPNSSETACAMPSITLVHRSDWLSDPLERRMANASVQDGVRAFLEHDELCGLSYRLVFTLDAPRLSPEAAKEYQADEAYESSLHLAVFSPDGRVLSDTETPVVFAKRDGAVRYSFEKEEMNEPIMTLVRQFVCGMNRRGEWMRPPGFKDAPASLNQPTACYFDPPP